MKNKYILCGLNYDLIIDEYPNLEEYEQALIFYLEDSFFVELRHFIEIEDYAMAKEATKGLYILASNLKLFNLYMALIDIYEDIESDNFKALPSDYEKMIEIHSKIKGAFLC